MLVSRNFWQNFQQYIWLVFGLTCLFAALIFWAVTDKNDLVQVEKPIELETQIEIKPETIAAATSLGALSSEVKPLDTSSRVVVATEHLPEFRGTKFVEDHQKQYSVELFRTANESIVKNFLSAQADRKSFVYLRLNIEDQPEQYVLLSGLFARMEDAKLAIGQLPIKLPASIDPKVVQIKAYKEYVNDLGSDELKNGLAQIYAVVLRPAAIPKLQQNAPVPVNSAPQMTTTTLKTTVTRKDDQGKVVDVKQSQSQVQLPPATSQSTETIAPNNTPKEVIDPFN